jgi:hypothetical protein
MSEAACFAARALAEEKAVLGGPRTMSSGAVYCQRQDVGSECSGLVLTRT